MKHYKTIIQIVLVLVSSKWGHAQQKSNVFVWGINGHPFSQAAYQDKTWDDQFQFLKDLKVGYYRVDVSLDKNGWSKKDQSFFSFIKKLKEHNVTLMPVIFPNEGKMLDDSASVYETYYKQGKVFTQRYGALLDVVEVGNEWDVKLTKSRKVDGTRASHYDLVKAQRRMWLLAGFIDGMKAVNPRIKVSVSLGWTHWYYLELLRRYNVNYDIMGYHWYSDMGDITNVRKPYGNFLPQLKEKYKKEIWITEFNTHNGTLKSSFEAQQRYIRKSLENILKQKNTVNGVFIYELFDQPALRVKYPYESSYGLVFKENGQFVLKPAYYTFKDFIKRSIDY